MTHTFRKAILLVTCCLFSSCASKFDRQLTDNGPKGSNVLAVDLSRVSFYDLTGKKDITVLEYMTANHRDFLLLTFGSLGCGICNEKAKIIEDKVIGKHSLYSSDKSEDFEIIGINTDRGTADEISPKLSLTPFIRWTDPGGLAMVAHFMPEGRRYQVPLTVMLNREGIVFRYLPEDKYSVSELMEEVAGVVGVTPEPIDSEPPLPEPTPQIPEVPASALDFPRPGRLKSVAVASCAEQELTLHEALAHGNLSFVQVTTDGQCDDICMANQTLLATVCGTGEDRLCNHATLLRDGFETSCAREAVSTLRGGGEFLSSNWLSLFDYEDLPIDDGEFRLPPVAGSLIYGFSEDGRLVFKAKGRLDEASVAAIVGASERATVTGAAFPLYGTTAAASAPRTLTLADVYQSHAYTIISTWGTECTSCEAELKHWVEEGQLHDFCEADRSFCSLYIHETHEPQEPYTEVAPYYEGVRLGWEDDFSGYAGLDTLGIPMLLLLDPVSGAGDGYLSRFFDGYLLARYPQWRWSYRTVIYDVEGKIVAAFPARTDLEGEDPVLAKMQELKVLFQDGANEDE